MRRNKRPRRSIDETWEITKRARRLLASNLVWDNHACVPLRPDDTSFLPQLERFRHANVDVVSLNVGFGPQGLDALLRMLASLRRWFGGRGDQYVLAGSVTDLDRAKDTGKLAVMFDVEGMGLLDGGDHGVVQLLRDLGVRWMLVAYNRENAAGAGCFDKVDGGLTDHGRAVLAEMKRVGMVVCCSHTGHRTAREVMECADNPVIFSHSNTSAVHEHGRNIPDELIRACAATGGVVGVNGVNIFLGEPRSRAERVVEHLDHVVQLVGPDHAGIGLDYTFDHQELASLIANMGDSFAGYPTPAQSIDFLGPEAIVEVTAGLLARGYPEGDVGKILGGNWRRVADSVWSGVEYSCA